MPCVVRRGEWFSLAQNAAFASATQARTSVVEGVSVLQLAGVKIVLVADEVNAELNEYLTEAQTSSFLLCAGIFTRPYFL